MAKRQLAENSSVEAEVLSRIDRAVKAGRELVRYECGHVGTEIGIKAKAFVRWAEMRHYLVEDEPNKKCPECK
jgi:phosphosulfolactate synthase (CoM biosynthesis protein A)